MNFATNPEYATYLQSQAWSLRCCRKLAKDGGLSEVESLYLINHWPCCRDMRFQCEDCGIRVPRRYLHVHHKTYNRIFHERNSDLLILCEGCHAMLHEKDIPDWRLGVAEGCISEEDLAAEAKPMALCVAECLTAQRRGKFSETRFFSQQAEMELS